MQLYMFLSPLKDGTIELTSKDTDPFTGDVQASYKDLQKSILRLTHEDVDSLMLHFDWLEGLKSEVERSEPVRCYFSKSNNSGFSVDVYIK